MEDAARVSGSIGYSLFERIVLIEIETILSILFSILLFEDNNKTDRHVIFRKKFKKYRFEYPFLIDDSLILFFFFFFFDRLDEENITKVTKVKRKLLFDRRK